MRITNYGKRTIWLFYFLCSIKIINSQTYFNKRIDIGGKSNASERFALYEDTFFINTQVQETPVPNLSFSSSLLQIDINGSVLSQKRYKNPNQYYSSPFCSIKINNNYYQSVATGAGNQIVNGILKYNQALDTIKTYIYGDTSYFSSGQRILSYTKTKDKFLIIGTTDSTCGSNHPGLYKPIIRVVDTNGVLSQTKTYLSGCEYRNINAADTSEDKGYLIGFNTTFGTWGFESRLMKLDSNLNFVWDKKMTETSGGYGGIINHQNNYYYHATTIVDSIWNFTYKWERPALSKVDKNGTVIWQKYYGVKQQYINLAGLKECSNGDFIMCGTRKLHTNEGKGFIIRTDSLGNLKWWKDYRPNTTPLDTLADNYLWDIMELPTGDIAAVGWASGSSLNPLQQTWLLKVDSNGCFGASNCPADIVTATKGNSYEKVGLVAFPNPFKEELNINYSIFDFNGVARLELIEIATGRIIDTAELTEPFGIKQFNTQSIASGLYMLSIKQNSKPSVNFKVINTK